MNDAEGPPIRLCICCQETELAITQRQTCTACLNHTRIDLNAVTDGYALLPAHLHAYSTRSPGAGEGGSRNAETPLMGGDVLSLIGYGSDDGEAAVRRAAEEDAGRKPEPSVERPGDAPSVLFELERWEAMWRSDMGISAATTKATITNVTSFLHEHLTWAAQNHPAFDQFATDVRNLRGHVERAMGVIDLPENANVDCYCGATLIRSYGPTGREDDWRCPKCRRVYDDAQFFQAYRQNLLDRAGEADRFLTVYEIASLLGITAAGVRLIVKRKEIKRRGKEAQAKLYDWRDFRSVGYAISNSPGVTFRPEESA